MSEPIIWNIEQGLTYIREIEQQSFDLHYNLSLGGGVMVRGQSSHDLDIICTPANGTFDADANTYNNFITWLGTLARAEGSPLEVGWWNGTTKKACFNDRYGRKIDWFVGFNAVVHENL